MPRGGRIIMGDVEESHVAFAPDAMTSAEVYALLTNIVVPRPIAFVSTLSADGIPNLAPFSFFILGGANPPSVAFSPVHGKSGPKDTLRNIQETGEYVINTVHRSMAPGMNQASASLPADVSEWDVSGFATLPSEIVRPSRVAESDAQFECKLFRVVEHGDEPGAARYVIGEIVRIHVRPELLNAEAQFRPVARLGGADYLDLEKLERFSLARP